MQRIDDATAANALPAPEAAGTPGYFTEGDPATPTPATLLRASWANMVQEELVTVVVAAGIGLSKTVYTQVRDAILYLIQRGTPKYAADTGAVNTLTATLSPVPAALTDGMEVRVKVGHTNTGAVTLNVNALGAQPVTSSQVALGAGSLTAGSIYSFVWNAALNAWELQTPLASAGASAVLADPGYKIWPDGYVEQWGNVVGAITHEGSVSITFPFVGMSQCFIAHAWALNSSASNIGNTTLQTQSYMATGATFYVQDDVGGSGAAATGFGWRCVGKI